MSSPTLVTRNDRFLFLVLVICYPGVDHLYILNLHIPCHTCIRIIHRALLHGYIDTYNLNHL